MSDGDHGESARTPGGIDSARARLAASRGREYWRSLEELSGDPAFQDLLHREFPRHASEWEDGLDRRRFLQLAAASLALAGLSACSRQPLEAIVPYVKLPEEIVPGRPRFFATAATLGGAATGPAGARPQAAPPPRARNPDPPSRP